MREDLNKIFNIRGKKKGSGYGSLRNKKGMKFQLKDYDWEEEIENNRNSSVWRRVTGKEFQRLDAISCQSFHQKESMWKHHGGAFWRHNRWDTYDGAIVGWLRKNVDKKERGWGDVHSEFCQTYDRRNAVNKKLYTMLMSHVETGVEYIDGELMVFHYGRIKYDWGSGWMPISKSLSPRFYVHPLFGHLSHNPFITNQYSKKQRAQERAEKQREYYIELDETHRFRKIKGIWYLYTLPYIYTTVVTRSKEDLDRNANIITITWEQQYPVYLFKKTNNLDYKYTGISEYYSVRRQLNYRELKQAGLINGPF